MYAILGYSFQPTVSKNTDRTKKMPSEVILTNRLST